MTCDPVEFPNHVFLDQMLRSDPGSLSQVLRARIWCENNLARGSWCCDHGGGFWFSSVDDAMLFRLTWC